MKSEAITNEGQIDVSTFAFIDVATHKALRRSILQEGDILFSMAGVYLGKTAVVPHAILPANTNQAVGIIKLAPSKAVPRFIHYVLSSPICRAFVNRSVAQSAQPNFNLRDIGSLPIPAMSLPEQRGIAHILGTLDDKIELNRRMNETLEAIARAIFKSWFVDFDPVRAKAEGCDTGLPAHTATLFPDRFEESELGEIPKGWRVGAVGDFAEHPRRGVQPSEIEPATPYIALEHMPKHCIALAEWGAAEGLESNKFEFRKGEILYGKLRPYFHKVGVAPVHGVCSTDIVVVAPRADNWFGFALGHLSSDAFVEYTNAGSTGTKMPRTSWGEMARYAVVLPPESVAQAFTEQVRPAVARIMASIHESRTLAAVRDALLPKLISGELRVKDAVRVVEGAGWVRPASLSKAE